MHTFFVAIVVVFGLTALIALAAWYFVRDTLKFLEDPGRRRRSLIRLGILYCICAAFVIVEVLMGKEPLQALFGLPIGLFFIWWYFKAASRIKVPPKDTPKS